MKQPIQLVSIPYKRVTTFTRDVASWQRCTTNYVSIPYKRVTTFTLLKGWFHPKGVERFQSPISGSLLLHEELKRSKEQRVKFVSIPYKRVTTFTPCPISPLFAKPNKLYLALFSPNKADLYLLFSMVFVHRYSLR